MINHISPTIYHQPYITQPYTTGDLFDRSVKAELKKAPRLLLLTPQDADADPPEILFRARLKGYFMCNKLCRIWVLQALRDARARGEFFVKWTNTVTGKTHDGTLLFAHFITIKYLSLHKPGMSVMFDDQGALKSTSCHVHKVRNYVWGYRHMLARRCHDMAKQMYANKKYIPKQWKPLYDWMYPNPELSKIRSIMVTKFNKEDDELHRTVAKCLWNVATGDNLPWGRSARQPRGYSAIPITEKVGMFE